VNETDPAAYPRRVLLAIAGLSPQVVTETLYALAVSKTPAFLPSEIHLLTTSDGAERAMLTLLSDEPGWFHRLCSDYRIPEPRFGPGNIHVLHDRHGLPLPDLRTAEEAECAADQILDLVRAFTADDSAALHVSMAGGRKSMGFFAGYSISLLGRPQDRLSHVLVTPPFESHRDFFYPAPSSRVIFTGEPDSRPLDASKAEVELTEIPIVRLRHALPKNMLSGVPSFREAVTAAGGSIAAPLLRIDLSGARIQAGARVISLPHADLAFLSWLARRRTLGREPVSCPSEGAPDRIFAEEYRLEYGQTPQPGRQERTLAALARGMEKSFFLERKSRLHRRLEQALGPAAAPFRIQGYGRRPGMTFGLDLNGGRIEYGPVREENSV
jgi:CRISPR-associated protein (TIGR02584 family)